MNTFVQPETYYLGLTMVIAVIAIIFGLMVRSKIAKMDPGDEKMQTIAAYIKEGAKAYMNRQYTTIFYVAIVLFTVLFVLFGLRQGWKFGAFVAFGFLIGASFSAAAGYI